MQETTDDKIQFKLIAYADTHVKELFITAAGSYLDILHITRVLESQDVNFSSAYL